MIKTAKKIYHETEEYVNGFEVSLVRFHCAEVVAVRMFKIYSTSYHTGCTMTCNVWISLIKWTTASPFDFVNKIPFKIFISNILDPVGLASGTCCMGSQRFIPRLVGYTTDF